MKFVKIIALILVAVMCLGIFASCAESTEGNTEHTRPQGEGSDEGNNFAQADYAGEKFTFLVIQQLCNNRDYYGGDFLDSDGYTGDTISDAVYARNLACEEKYNVEIDQRIEPGQPSTTLNQFIMAGDFCFDISYGWCYKMGGCIVNNYFADINDLPTADLSAEYWAPSAVDSLTVNGKLYLTLNDITMNKLEWAHFVFFNKAIYEDYNLESEFGNLYDAVNDGTWTLDKYLALVQSISTDVDGNGKITKDDVYGDLGGIPEWAVPASDITLTSTNEDGTFSLSFYSEKLLDVINKINPVYTSHKFNVDFDDIWAEGTEGNGAFNDQYEYARSFFSNDHALFTQGSANITGEFRNMKSEYGILPLPKYDENQENYVASMDYNASIFAIPSTVRQDVSSASMERTSNILEYLAYKSNEVLLPVYYDTLLKGQRLNNEEDSAMLDIVRNSIRYELARVVGLNDIGDLVGVLCKKPNSATSTYKRQEKKLQKALDDFYMEILKLDQLNEKAAENN